MMKMTKSWLAPIFAAATLGMGCQSEGNSTGSPSSASPTTGPQSGQNAPTSQNARGLEVKLDDATKTRIVLTELHAANQAEISEGKLANDRGQNADVKKFAGDMVSDHSAADQKLTDLAKRLEIDVNSSPTNPVEVAMSEAGDARRRMLASLSGAAFDVAYLAPQAHQHELVLELIAQGQKTAPAEVKRLLDEMKPTIESHREHARSLLRGFRFEATAVGGGPAGARSSMEGVDTSGRNDTNITPTAAKHDGGAHVRKDTTQ